MENSLTLGTLLESKRYVKGNVTFGDAGEYVTPFLDLANKYGFGFAPDVAIQDPVINVNDDGSENISYPRVNLNIKGPVSDNGLSQTFGLVYGLDIGHPVIKTYTGTEATACTNLYVFNATHVAEQNILTSSLETLFELTETWFANAQEIREKNLEIYTKLKNTMLGSAEVKELFGKLILRATQKSSMVPSSLVISAARQLQDKSSSYYVPDDVETIPLMQVYDALTYTNSRKTGLLYRADKSLALYDAILN